MSLPLELIGFIPAEYEQDLGAFVETLRAHPWGGDNGVERVAAGDAALVREWMEPDDYADWRRSYQEGRLTDTGGVHFIAKDGLSTAVVPAGLDRHTFRMLAGHEVVEATLERRQLEEGYEFEERTHTGFAHVLWTEYAVERTRRFIANDLRWEPGELEAANGPLRQLEKLEAETLHLARRALLAPEAPPEMYHEWFTVARLWVMARGRADAGSPVDTDELTQFAAKPLPAQSADGWAGLHHQLREVYASPGALTEEHDYRVCNEGWMHLFDELVAHWNHAVAHARVGG